MMDESMQEVQERVHAELNAPFASWEFESEQYMVSEIKDDPKSLCIWGNSQVGLHEDAVEYARECISKVMYENEWMYTLVQPVDCYYLILTISS